MKISIIVPFFNEEKTIQTMLERIYHHELKYTYEVILVDDGSTDSSIEIINRMNLINLKIVRHRRNQGKGAAIRTGLAVATGDIIIVQDADLEYDPADYPALLRPIIEGKTKVVYGSRAMYRVEHYSYFHYYLGGKFLTILTNLLYNLKITDESTGYKVFRADLLKKLPLKCKGFEFCPEITALVAKSGEKIVDVPIAYYPRSFKEGKKIRMRDGLMAIWTLFKYKLLKVNF